MNTLRHYSNCRVWADAFETINKNTGEIMTIIVPRICKRPTCTHCNSILKNKLIKQIVYSCEICHERPFVYHFVISFRKPQFKDSFSQYKAFKEVWKNINRRPPFCNNSWFYTFHWIYEHGSYFMHVHGMLRCSEQVDPSEYSELIAHYGLGSEQGQELIRVRNHQGLLNVAEYTLCDYGRFAPAWFSPPQGRDKRWKHQSTKDRKFLLDIPKSKWKPLYGGKTLELLKKDFELQGIRFYKYGNMWRSN